MSVWSLLHIIHYKAITPLLGHKSQNARISLLCFILQTLSLFFLSPLDHHHRTIFSELHRYLIEYFQHSFL
ncbi:hypothetical protein VNO77_41369 [Canavalia gladiata]|uniref:Uncharacterized protein n=1 Tax=Canavalia gladiata TaxID=3824 RepID=A0AAN9JZ04_CANGL